MDVQDKCLEQRIGIGLQQGTLQQLKLLLHHSHSLQEILDNTHRTQSDLNGMKDQVQQLQKQRHELALRLAFKQSTHTLLDELYEEKASSDADSSSVGPDLDTLREHVSSAVKRRRAECEQLLYQLTGQTLVPVSADADAVGLGRDQKDDEMAIRLETCHLGRYLERYYVVLAYSKLTSQPRGQVFVRKHTLPHFVPVQQIAEKHLNSDLKEFLFRLHEYLDALVTRREDLKHLQNEYPEAITKVNASVAFDSIEFYVTSSRGQEDEKEFKVKLEYAELTHFRPKTVKVKLVSDKGVWNKENITALIRAAEQKLKQFSLLEALRSSVLRDE